MYSIFIKAAHTKLIGQIGRGTSL